MRSYNSKKIVKNNGTRRVIRVSVIKVNKYAFNVIDEPPQIITNQVQYMQYSINIFSYTVYFFTSTKKYIK